MASAWGLSWGSSWGNSWGAVGAAAPAAAVTVAGRRSAASSYSYKTLGRVRRDKERELKRLAAIAQQNVERAIDSGETKPLLQLIRQEVKEAVPASANWLTAEMRASIVNSILAYQRAELARIREQEDEEDAEFLLLVA